MNVDLGTNPCRYRSHHFLCLLRRWFFLEVLSEAPGGQNRRAVRRKPSRRPAEVRPTSFFFLFVLFFFCFCLLLGTQVDMGVGVGWGGE